MQSRYLAYFKKVAELRNMTAASEQLFISQSQLSRIIAEIEKEVGCPLFDRDKHGMEPNAAGRVFLQYAKRMLGEFEEGIVRARDAYDNNHIHFTFGTNMDFMVHGMVEAVTAKIPTARFHQYTAPLNVLVDMVTSGGVGSIVTAQSIEAPGILNDPFCTDHMVLIYPESSRFAHAKRVDLAELRDEQRVCFTKGYGFRNVVEPAYHNFALPEENIAVETTGAHAIVEYVRLGFGVALLPRSFALRNEYCRTHNAELVQDLTYQITVSWNIDHVMRPLDDEYHGIIRDYFIGYVEGKGL